MQRFPPDCHLIPFQTLRLILSRIFNLEKNFGQLGFFRMKVGETVKIERFKGKKVLNG